MRVQAIVAVERDGRLVPICRTSRREVVREVGRAAIEEVRAAAHDEREEIIAALLHQEAERLERGLAVLGVGREGERC